MRFAEWLCNMRHRCPAIKVLHSVELPGVDREPVLPLGTMHGALGEDLASEHPGEGAPHRRAARGLAPSTLFLGGGKVGYKSRPADADRTARLSCDAGPRERCTTTMRRSSDTEGGQGPTKTALKRQLRGQRRSEQGSKRPNKPKEKTIRRPRGEEETSLRRWREMCSPKHLKPYIMGQPQRSWWPHSMALAVGGALTGPCGERARAAGVAGRA